MTRLFVSLVGSLMGLGIGCGEPSKPAVEGGGGGGTASAMAGSAGMSPAAGGTAQALGGAAGASSGSSGAPTAGGNSGAATGGSANAGGNAGSGGAPGAGLCEAGDCTHFVGMLDGFVYTYPSGTCAMGALTVTRDFNIQGDAGKVYRLKLRVRGITESKNYEGGMRRSMAAIDPGPAGGDLWYEGGTAPLSTYSSFELHVKPALTGAPNDYFLNARDGTNEHDGTTWPLDYEASIDLNGGSTLTFKTFDSNCSAINNCGPKGTSPCTPRTLDLSDAVPAASLMQPPLDDGKKPVQWLHIDVLDATAL